MIIGHRGASSDAPENTIAAFKEAWNQNADGVEGDFHFTRDQRIVCIHDKDTMRTGGTKLTVATSTLAELRQLEYGGWKAAKFQGEPIPLLSDVLQAIPDGKQLVIELKTDPAIVPLLKEELSQHAFDPSRILIISFNEATVAKCKELLPEIKAHWLTGYEQNKETKVWHPTVDEITAKLLQSHADGLGTKADRNIVTENFIRALKEQGMKEFHVWTVDDPGDALYFQKLGAIGITTNRPAFIRSALSK